ncbi:MerR family transcriptional regulator [Gordonia spumicola]|uniref:MerR family transcriptional regulator n=1 Tax=Gordonia spumicola TaxID=589161 RepID=A0A7I9VFD9_9ACTN|nr:TOBE domain-containing protein [Gordonia spumicola]GED99935.1 MerR family transcriptional regulator [Gordonia spumicola]GEE04067.1 MerR family transcriptional regulator [Gordonia spumicola]GEE04076.1 MerR family transcriptional regulator [Gordonia spumicola]
MTAYRVREAAELVGVSDDTFRRWIDQGRIAAARDHTGRTVVDGGDLARLLETDDSAAADPIQRSTSARNRFVGIVTRIHSDPVMSQVELRSGPHRVVSLMSTEAVEELGLVVGSQATATVKATAVVVETRQDNR